jgi:hypothetical protein
LKLDFGLTVLPPDRHSSDRDFGIEIALRGGAFYPEVDKLGDKLPELTDNTRYPNTES